MNFDAQVSEWVAQTKERIEVVFKTATQELFYGCLTPVTQGGRMRVKTGFLRASFSASLDAPIGRVTTNPNPTGTDEIYSVDSGAISLTINQAELGQTIYGMFTANYARPREYGSRGKPGDGFVLAAASRWQEYVNEAALKVQGEN